MVVVLPAPLRPTRPIRSPGCTRRAAPSVSSSVRAPARTSRSVAVITILLPSAGLPGRLLSSRKTAGRFSARAATAFEVRCQEADIQLAESLGLHVPSRLLASSPLHSVRLVNSVPGRRTRQCAPPSRNRSAEGHPRNLPGHQADPFGLVRVDVAPGEHHFEGAGLPMALGSR